MNFNELSGIYIIVAIIIATGLLGGTRNVASEIRLGAKPGCALFIQVFADALIAAGAVPLFLSLIGNGILSTILNQGAPATIPNQSAPDRIEAYLKFIGFCLIAAFYSRRFLDTLSAKVLQEAKAARQDAREAKEISQEAQAAVGAVVEPSEKPNLMAATAAGSLNENETKILKAFFSGPFVIRSVTGVSLSSGLPENDCVVILEKLESIGLVQRIPTRSGERWAATPAGRIKAQG